MGTSTLRTTSPSCPTQSVSMGTSTLRTTSPSCPTQSVSMGTSTLRLQVPHVQLCWFPWEQVLEISQESHIENRYLACPA